MDDSSLPLDTDKDSGPVIPTELEMPVAQPDKGPSIDTGPIPAFLAHTATQQQGFDAFFRTNYRMLVGYALGRGVSLVEAKEVVAAAMLDVDRAWEGLGNPLAYATTAVWSHICRLYRDRNRGLSPLPDYVEDDTGPGEEDAGLSEQENVDWLQSKLCKLTSAMRQVVEGMFLDGLSIAEASQRYGKTEQAIRKQLQLARRRLQAEWKSDLIQDFRRREEGLE